MNPSGEPLFGFRPEKQGERADQLRAHRHPVLLGDFKLLVDSLKIQRDLGIRTISGTR